MRTVAEIDAELAKLQAERFAAKCHSTTWPKQLELSLCSSKESNRQYAEQINLSEIAYDNFRYCCYEVMLTLQVSQDGHAVCTHFAGVALVQPAKVA